MLRRFVLGLAVAIPLLLTACSGDSGPGPEIHDTKYAAIGFNSEQLDITTAEAWPCVLDQFTGLMWEVKTDSPGLHDWRNTYSWYEPEESHDQGLDYRGVPGGGECSDSDCDTWAFVQAVNANGYCGHQDWRLPTRDELASLSDLRKIGSPPTMNVRYFPFGQSQEYWSSNDYHFQWNAAWLWNFEFGHDRVDWKKAPKLVRLVRGEALYLERIED